MVTGKCTCGALLSQNTTRHYCLTVTEIRVCSVRTTCLWLQNMHYGDKRLYIWCCMVTEQCCTGITVTVYRVSLVLFMVRKQHVTGITVTEQRIISLNKITCKRNLKHFQYNIQYTLQSCLSSRTSLENFDS